MNQAFKRCYVFGEFRLDGAERQLLRAGTPVLLPPKILDTLLLLVENAGHLVAKDEFMKQLWPGTFVGEDALARNISILRKTLGESSDSQSFIATVPTRGYRFVAPVQKLNGTALSSPEENPSLPQTDFSPSAVAVDKPLRQPSQQQRPAALLGLTDSIPINIPAPHEIPTSHLWRRRVAFAVLVLAAGSFAGFVTYYLLSPAPVPRVLRTVQLTHSGRIDPWASMVTDGSRIYFNERAGDHWNLAQTSVAGGDTQIVPAPFPNPVVRDISPDHANLLIGSFARRYALMPFWIWPVQGGPPRRVGDITAYDAAWSPNGREIIFAEDDGIHIANADGTNSRKFVPWEGRTGAFSWSPDGRFLRFTAAIPGTNSPTLWEVHSDGTSLRRLLSGWNSSPNECCGSWSPDGRYYFFHSPRSGTNDIWALPVQRGWLHHRSMEPVRLTTGPTDFYGPLASPDGRRVFAYGIDAKGDWVRFDLRSRQFLPVLPGVSLAIVSFSPDGEWLTYVSYPDYTLIRMRRDGTQRLVVAPPSLHPWVARWSPDGKQIVFTSAQTNRSALFLVSPEGRAPRELLPDGGDASDPAWSPDGKVLAFNRQEKGSLSIYLYRLPTNQISRLPESQGLWEPSWSPDGRFITAKTEDEHRLMLFDSRTQKWTQLAQANLIYDAAWWSSDGKCIYYQDLLAPNEPVYCLHWPSKKQEVAVSFEQLLRAGANRAAFIGLGPGGSLLAALERNHSDIYALDVDFP